MLPILSLDSFSLQPRNVATSKRLGDSETNKFPAGEDLRDDFIFYLLRSEVDDWRETDDRPGHDAVSITTGTGAS